MANVKRESLKYSPLNELRRLLLIFTIVGVIESSRMEFLTSHLIDSEKGLNMQLKQNMAACLERH